MNTLLSIAHSALQYHRGKQTGIAGLIGIAIAIIAVYQWDKLLPLFKALGIVGFLEKNGLIYKDEPAITGFVIYMLLFRAVIIFCVLVAAALVLAMVFTMIFSSEKIAIWIILPFLAVIIFPIILLIVLFEALFLPKSVKEERERERIRLLGSPLDQLLSDSSEILSREQALSRLNRLPTDGDYFFILGVTEEIDTESDRRKRKSRKDEKKKLYMLLPRPINLVSEKFSMGDVAGIEYKVAIYDERIHKISWPTPEPKKFFIYPSNEEKLEYFSNTKISYFYQSNNRDAEKLFKSYSYEIPYRDYVKEIQNWYFLIKEGIFKRMSNASTQEEFDREVANAKKLNAANEDIVKMMRESEKPMEI